MIEIHAFLGFLSFASLAGLGLLLVVAAIWRPPDWIGPTWIGVVGLLALEGVVGLALFIGGSRPAEWTHFVYGVVVVLLLLVAPLYASTMVPRTRLRILAAGATVAALLAFRLLQTA